MWLVSDWPVPWRHASASSSSVNHRPKRARGAAAWGATSETVAQGVAHEGSTSDCLAQPISDCLEQLDAVLVLLLERPGGSGPQALRLLRELLDRLRDAAVTVESAVASWPSATASNDSDAQASLASGPPNMLALRLR